MFSDYFRQINKLFLDTMSFSGYKKHKILGICLSIITILPFLDSIGLIAMLYLYAFIIKMFSYPSDFISEFLHREVKNMEPFPKGVVYSILFPINCIATLCTMLLTWPFFYFMLSQTYGVTCHL